ncbi:MAG: hypothetical protein CL844_10135 [Crocinitomicaceae bacterium]|nr:hypothetical protein [Crocinitomicaceae bacterium]|tara:strand:+ start:8949 stop:9959 length:1011 start_codon:yes stop_codon:yes gene_type:complete
MDCSYFNTNNNIDTSFWNQYSNRVSESFLKMHENRLEPMRKWKKTISSNNKLNDTSLLFYPFSGADFLHAYYLFPEANDYVLIAQEKIGDLPDFNSISSQKLKLYLNAVDHSLGDIYKRSYFITKSMMADTKEGSELNGLLPLFYWFISRTDHEIINVSNVYVDSNSKLNTFTSSIENKLDKKIKGIKFLFRKKGDEKLKSITYFNCDISNKGFNKNPEFKTYLNSIRTCNSFVKSASYLMHYSTFSDIRGITLEKSNSILEDDTGIPFKYLNNGGWDINLFGVYVMPVKDFSESRFQKDLSEAYMNETFNKGKLPFSLGYHWGSKEQNQMLYIKK